MRASKQRRISSLVSDGVKRETRRTDADMSARALVEPLEPRAMLSVTVRLHRHWRHPSHTVAPDALIGSYSGSFTGRFDMGPLRLTLARNGTGGYSLSVPSIFSTFDNALVYAYSDGTILVGGDIGVSRVLLKGSRTESANGLTISGDMSGRTGFVFVGVFSLTKIS